jgi:hypothetical protein
LNAVCHDLKGQIKDLKRFNSLPAAARRRAKTPQE